MSVSIGETKGRTTRGKINFPKQLSIYVGCLLDLIFCFLFSNDSQALEEVGLKWSMLATTAWDDMFDSLREYAEAKVRICCWRKEFCGFSWFLFFIFSLFFEIRHKTVKHGMVSVFGGCNLLYDVI